MRALLVAVSLLCLAQPTSAQRTPTVRFGDRVKLQHMVLRESDTEVRRVRSVGRLDSLERDTVFISTAAVALSSVSTVQVSIGRQPNVLRDATIGFVIGAVVGQVIVNNKLNTQVFQTQADLDARKKELRPLTMAVALLGGGVGAAVGKRGHQAWVDIELTTLLSALGAGRQ